jgi:hypothetical protein
VLRHPFIAGAECGLGGPTDTTPTNTIVAMDPVDPPFDGPVEAISKLVRAPIQVGAYRAFVRARDSLGLTGPWASADFRVATNGYYIWAGDLGLTGANGLPAADPDGDGLINAAEYACNLNPFLASRVLLPSGSGTQGVPNVALTGTGLSRRLRVEYIRRKDTNAITYQVMSAQTLSSESAAWQPAVGTESVTSVDSEWDRVTFEDGQAIGDQSARFLKVDITLRP